MDQQEYLAASERTEKKFPEGMVLTGEHQVIFNFLTDDLITIGEGMDNMKRHLIYGADLGIKAPQSELMPAAKKLDPMTAELLHAALGKVTESIEFFDMMLNHVKRGTPLDVANAIEEVGDGMWYDAMGLRLLGSSFDQAAQINIDKLKARFPDKFTSENALNRDLVVEREILEGGLANGEIPVVLPKSFESTPEPADLT